MGIKAELHGKVSSSGNNITDTLEDLLTSNVFQLLRYIPLEIGLLSILNEAVNIDGEKLILPDEVNEAEVHFWKRFKRSEPDLFIELKEGDQLVSNIMIEAKYLSGKSGMAVYEGEESNQLYVEGSDQLEREWSDLIDYSKSQRTPCLLIYLTTDWVMPIKDIKESIRAIGDEFSKKNTYWLNWQTIHKTLQRNLSVNADTLTKIEKIVIEDITALLKKKDLTEYSGINITDYSNLLPVKYFNLGLYSNMPQLELTQFNYFDGGLR